MRGASWANMFPRVSAGGDGLSLNVLQRRLDRLSLERSALPEQRLTRLGKLRLEENARIAQAVSPSACARDQKARRGLRLRRAPVDKYGNRC